MGRFNLHPLGSKILAGVSILLGIIGIILIVTGSSKPNPIPIVPEIAVAAHVGDTPENLDLRTLWPNGVVPYTIDPTLDGVLVQEILAAIAILERKTCIEFLKIEVVRHEDLVLDWVHFAQNNSVCANSPLGLSSSNHGMHKIQIGLNCFTSSIVQRMLGRVLGFDYEETRPDRDRYIRYEPNCKSTNLCGDIPIGNHKEAVLKIFFDYTSHMFRRADCLEPVLNGRINFGSSDEETSGTFSPLDIEKLNAMYNCSGCKSYRFLPTEKVFASVNSSASFEPVIGGLHGDGVTPLYICRAYQLGSILIGKLHSWKSNLGDRLNDCWIDDRGREHVYEHGYEVLTNAEKTANLVWKKKIDARIPENAVVGGRTQDRTPIYIGRCRLSLGGRAETVVTGSIYPNMSTFKAPYGHRSTPCPLNRQEILVCEE